MPQITYKQLRSFQLSGTRPLFIEDCGEHLRVSLGKSMGGDESLYAQVTKIDADGIITADHQDLIDRYGWNAEDLDDPMMRANRPVYRKEERFGTPDFADGKQHTWDCRTTGNIAAWAAGGVVQNPVNGLWLNMTGAGVLQAWSTDGGPARLMLGEPNGDDVAAFIAMGQNQLNIFTEEFLTRIGYGDVFNATESFYDDVRYRWIAPNGDVLAKLDLSDLHDGAPIWKDGADNPIVRYDALAKKWFRKDVSDEWTIDVTDSTCRFMPYQGYKLEAKQVDLYAHVDTTFETSAGDGTGRLHYRGMGYGDDHSRPRPAPAAGIWCGQDYVYSSREEFARTTNGPKPEPNADGFLTMTFDYTKTAPNWIDSAQLQFVDVFLEGHKAMTGTAIAVGWFFCVNWDSM